ncbi:Hsp20/alpha crystallin family protein [Halapricum salinum]|uniref:Hsp20/alpha crystallin family protein n=1 Tax=Halapricum salinum TaxID=1457250 RepID=A0A4D6HAJ9_9EURY|nr:Hsp20/alpha crystallin family protein [Halapricum salinum]QCC50840.1 Hsp20/alpha crystallin family protein [Halapricum salinum]
MTSLRDVGKSLSNVVLENVGRAMSRAQERTPLPVDLLESDDAYLAVFDAPGATSSDVQVRFTDRTVEVRVDRFREFYEDFEMLVPGRGLSLDGSVTLPEGASVDPDAATATLHDNGSLHVEIPKVEAEDADEASDEEVDIETDDDASDDS